MGKFSNFMQIRTLNYVSKIFPGSKISIKLKVIFQCFSLGFPSITYIFTLEQ